MLKAAYFRSINQSMAVIFCSHLNTFSCHGNYKERKIYLFQDSFTGIFKRPVFCRAPEWWQCARGCCVFRHELPSSEGPEKDSGLVLEPSWKEEVVPLGGTCVAQNLQMGEDKSVRPAVSLTIFQTSESFQSQNHVHINQMTRCFRECQFTVCLGMSTCINSLVWEIIPLSLR